MLWSALALVSGPIRLDAPQVKAFYRAEVHLKAKNTNRQEAILDLLLES
jgi:hypothetical protein